MLDYVIFRISGVCILFIKFKKYDFKVKGPIKKKSAKIFLKNSKFGGISEIFTGILKEN